MPYSQIKHCGAFEITEDHWPLRLKSVDVQLLSVSRGQRGMILQQGTPKQRRDQILLALYLCDMHVFLHINVSTRKW